MSPLTMTETTSRRSTSPTIPASPARPATESRPYTTLMELREELNALDERRSATVVLALDERFCGHVASLIERRDVHTAARPALRLVLVVGTGRLPGLETIGDLAASGSALGWQEIVMESDADAALAGALATLRTGERLIAFVPSWHATNDVARLLQQSP